MIVAGQIGVAALFHSARATVTVCQGAIQASEGLRVVGALWLAIAVLSTIGLSSPRPMSAVLALQLVYMFSWLLVAGIPALRAGASYPRGMFWSFVVWGAVLPWVIPGRYLFGGAGE